MAHIVIDIKGQAVHFDAAEARRILCELRELLEAEAGAGKGASVPWTGPGYVLPTGTKATPPYTLTIYSPAIKSKTAAYPNVAINSDIFE